MGVWASVVSTGRPDAPEEISGLVGEATWYTRPEDTYGDVRVSGGLCAARNAALDDAFASGLPCLQLSDDLRHLLLFKGDRIADPLSLEEAVGILLSELGRSDACLAGVAPTANWFYASTRVKRQHFVVGDLIVVLPTDLRFDTTLKLKEDYDYTCQHIERYGSVCRVDWILASFKHRSNPGGAVADRTPELDQEMIRRLHEKWPGWVKPNPRRPNEVLLKIPSLRRVKL